MGLHVDVNLLHIFVRTPPVMLPEGLISGATVSRAISPKHVIFRFLRSIMVFLCFPAFLLLPSEFYCLLFVIFS